MSRGTESLGRHHVPFDPPHGRAMHAGDPGLGRAPDGRRGAPADYRRHGDVAPEFGHGATAVMQRPEHGRHSRRPEPPPEPARRGVLGTIVQVIGELLLTAGVLAMLLVVYELWITDLFTAQAQDQLTQQLEREWAQQEPAVPTEPAGPTSDDGLALPGAGEHAVEPSGKSVAYAKLYLPSLDQHFTVVQGTTQANLADGPGHYPASPAPGDRGNMAIAGHRVGRGAPFGDLDLLRSCDALVVETRNEWLVYRVLPRAEDLANWNTGRGRDAACADVHVPTGAYTGVVGQQVVLPTQTEVVATVPGDPSAHPSGDDKLALITLTTCNPKFSARQRLIIHGELTARYDKDPQHPGARPTELQGM